MDADLPADVPSREHREAFDSSRADRESTLAAIHGLEEAAGTAASGREDEWLTHVLSDLRALQETFEAERTESLRPDSLLSMIARDYPRRFGSRVRQLREQHDDLSRSISSLRAQLEKALGDPVDVPDLRQRLLWLTEAMRHRRARESDMVFEAIRLDLGRDRE